MRGIKKYIVQIDRKSAETIKFGNSELFIEKEEGAEYLSMPFHGTVLSAPKGRIKTGDTVYMNYQAIDSIQFIEGKECYVIDEDLIVATGDKENIKAYNCVILEPKQEKLKSEFIEIIQHDIPDAVEGVVLSSDIDGIKDGDHIEYENNIDWEFLVNREKHFYIKWVHKIIKVNGEMRDGWIEFEKPPAFIEKNGLHIPNKDKFVTITSGEHSGKKAVFLDNRGAVKNGKYIHEDYIFGTVED